MATSPASAAKKRLFQFYMALQQSDVGYNIYNSYFIKPTNHAHAHSTGLDLPSALCTCLDAQSNARPVNVSLGFLGLRVKSKLWSSAVILILLSIPLFYQALLYVPYKIPVLIAQRLQGAEGVSSPVLDYNVSTNCYFYKVVVVDVVPYI